MTVRIINADCLKALPQLAAEGVRAHAVVCDPPYHLTSIVKRFGAAGAAPAKIGATGAYARASAGFMGQQWDGGDVAFRVETWAAVMACMRPGAHLTVFGGTRTFYRMAVAIEDAGFEIRDTLSWNYGSGFPKSHSVNKALGDSICCCDEPEIPPHQGRSVHPVRDVRSNGASVAVSDKTERADLLRQLVPEQDVCSSAANHSLYRTERLDSGLAEVGQRKDDRISQPCLERRRDATASQGQLRAGPICPVPGAPDEHGPQGRLRDGASAGDGGVGGPFVVAGGGCASSRPRPAEQPAQQPRAMAVQSQSQDGGAWPVCLRCGKQVLPPGLGTALKPSFEPIILARVPLDGTVAGNTLKHGCGGLNIDACRIGLPDGDALHEGVKHDGARLNPDSGFAFKAVDRAPGLGRWPANVLHDGSPEVLAAFGETESVARVGRRAGKTSGRLGDFAGQDSVLQGHTDAGSPARFFYSAKADAADRAGSKHPTVKPTDLMRWLVQLVTPPGGLVLDPFAGSGSTGLAADQLGMDAILIEQDATYAADAKRKIAGDAPLFSSVAAE